MPGSDSERDTGGGGRLLTVLFWTGVALAPLAALLLLLGNSGLVLRVAAVLAIGCIVLIGVSIALRGDPESVRADIEGTLLDEVDAVRDDVREDITTAARATHRAFGEKLQALNQTVDSLRAEVEATRAGAARAGARVEPAADADRTEPTRAGFEHAQAARAGFDRAEAGRADAGRADAGRAAAGRAEAGRAEPARGDYTRGDYTRGEAVRAEAPGARSELGRPEPVRARAGRAESEAARVVAEPARGHHAGGHGRPEDEQPASWGAGRGATPADWGGAGWGGAHGAAPAGWGGAHGAAPAGHANGHIGAASASIPQRTGGGGRVRHTETVRVTRETIVDDDGGAGRVYAAAQPAPATYGRPPAHANGYRDEHTDPDGWTPADEPPSRGRRAADPGAESWGERRRREQDGDAWAQNMPWAGREAPPSEAAPSQPHAPEAPPLRQAPRTARRSDAAGNGRAPQDDQQHGDQGWVGTQSGDRWATMRADERGSEIRMGERRAAVHADRSGAEVHVEDRWASVRREEPRSGRRHRDDDAHPQNSYGRDDYAPQAATYGGDESTENVYGRRDEAPARPDNTYGRRQESYDGAGRREDPRVPQPPPSDPGRKEADRGPVDGWADDDWMAALRNGPTAPELTARSEAPTWSQYEAAQPADAGGGRRRRDEEELPYAGGGYENAPRRNPDYELSEERWR